MGVSFNPINGEIIITPTTVGESVTSNPPAGKYRVKNLFVDSGTGKLQVEYSDVPSESWDYVPSEAPAGHHRVTNLFVDPETGKLEVEYDSAPEE